MNIYDAAALAAAAASSGHDRPATSLVHDSADARVVLFRIEPGQEVPAHVSRSTVLLLIIAGSGVVSGGETERTVHAGDIVAYDPHEQHGMRAASDELVIAAVIAPRAAAR